MKLACADFTWPLLAHERVLALIRRLDIAGVDLARAATAGREYTPAAAAV